MKGVNLSLDTKGDHLRQTAWVLIPSTTAHQTQATSTFDITPLAGDPCRVVTGELPVVDQEGDEHCVTRTHNIWVDCWVDIEYVYPL